GIFEHKVSVKNTPLLRGFDDIFNAPHSRHTETRKEDVKKIEGLQILSESDKAGLYIVASNDGRQVFVFGHPEYEKQTLYDEYKRDLAKNLEIEIPYNYFSNEKEAKGIKVTWYSHAQLLYSNWLNYYVYQTTPFDLNLLPSPTKDEKSPAEPKRIV
ncbi:MAG: homoserine O-succinyltransferase, partial [Sphaerochaetaceae bacterium]